jgi:hypothetical protein
VRDTAL